MNPRMFWTSLVDEVKTRAPIHFEWHPSTWFLQMFGTPPPNEDPDKWKKETEAFLKSLQDSPPEVMAGMASRCTVPFDWGPRGVKKGQFDPILGASTPENAPPCTGYERLPPEQLEERIRKIVQYTKSLHQDGGVKRVMPYIDFGTQLFGRHTRPTTIPDPCVAENFPDLDPQELPPGVPCPENVPPSVWGFWEFFDHWEEYAQPTGPFDLGLKPPDPKYWLRKWYDPNVTQPAWDDLPSELKGLSFAYGPKKCSVYGPHYRYATCLNTEGWRLWWKQVIQWAARVGYDGVFIDNAQFVNCWNEECQYGYMTWLLEKFTQEEIRRYFTTTNNKFLPDPNMEGPWYQIAGQWQTAIWTGSSAQGNSPIFPDRDAYRGRYSCRIEGPGPNNGVVSFGPISLCVGSSIDQNGTCIDPPPPNLRLAFHYKTEGSIQVRTVLTWGNIVNPPEPFEQNLHPAPTWQQEIVYIPSPPEGNPTLDLKLEVTGTGIVWVDAFWLGTHDQSPEYSVALWKPVDDGIHQPYRLHLWAAVEYWTQVATDRLRYLRAQAGLVNDKFQLFTNGFNASQADYFMIEGGAIDLNEQRHDRGFFPGTYLPIEPPIELQGTKGEALLVTESHLVTNLFDYKFIHSRRSPKFFGYNMPQWALAAEGYEPNTDSALLNLAEAAAFGGGAGCDSAGLRTRYTGWFTWNPTISPMVAENLELVEGIRAVEKQFWQFIQHYEGLYDGYCSHADVGIVYHDLPYNNPEYKEFHNIMDLATGLAGQGVLWDVVTENRCNAKTFSRLKVLIYQDVSRIADAEVVAVQEYLEQGGLVFAAGVVGDDDEWFRTRLPDPGQAWPPVGLAPELAPDNSIIRPRPDAFQAQVGAGTLIYHPDPLIANEVITAAEAHLQRKVGLVSGVPGASLQRLRLNAWVSGKAGRSMTLHVLNYNVPLGKDKLDQVQPLSNVQVSTPMPPQMKVDLVRLYSPESGYPPQAPSFTVAGDLVTFEIPSLRIYTLALIG